MYKMKSLLIAAIVALSVGTILIPNSPSSETNPTETTEVLESTEISPLADDPVES